MKNFRLAAEEIQQLVFDNRGCYASDRILVEGEKVGYMCREEPDYEADSGWWFFSGTEPEDYLEDPSNFGIYAVNTLANYDPEIIPFLYSPVGASFSRDPVSKQFVPEI
jgi:hypothetical protein